jgi:heat shock protein HslJ
MKSKIYLITVILFFVFSTSCSSQKKTANKAISTGDNSMTSLDWDGTYQGILPCGDCGGLQTQIVLNKDLTYVLETRYNGKDEKIFQTKGTFTWDTNGSKISLDPDNQSYLVGENRLFHLDIDGNRITGNLADNYILEKEKTELKGKYWKLSELNGQPVKAENREPFITFYEEENRVNGNNSCNTFNGRYEINEGNKIKFSPFMMTKMACIENKTEVEFMKILELTESYILTSNMLIFQDSEGKTLAKFQSYYFKPE